MKTASGTFSPGSTESRGGTNDQGTEHGNEKIHFEFSKFGEDEIGIDDRDSDSPSNGGPQE